LTLFENLAANSPEVPDHGWILAACLDKLGRLLAADPHRLPEAEQVFRRALTLGERLMADCPDLPDYQKALAQAHGRLRGLLRPARRWSEAERSYRQAVALLRQLTAAFPNRLDYHSQLGHALHQLACLVLGQGELAGAQALLEQALHHQQTALKSNAE